MNMKKSWFLLGLITLVSVFAFASGTQQGAGTAKEVELVTPTRIGNPDAKITLEWWVQQEYCHRTQRADVAEVYNRIYTEWAKANPNVKINVNIMPGNDELKQKLQLAASQGNAPDMAAVDSFWAPWFYSQGYLYPLNEFLSKEDINDFFPFITSGVSDDKGNIYALWHGTDCRVLYYNTDFVKTPPKTWDEMLTMGSQIKKQYNIKPFVFNGGRWEGTTFDAYAYFWAQGGDLVDLASGRPVFNEGKNRDYMVNVIAYLRELVASGVSPKAVATIMDYQEFEPYIQANDVAMIVGGNWQINDIKRLLPKEKAAKWEVAPIPQKMAGTYATGTGGWTWGILTKDATKAKAAYSFFAKQMETQNMAALNKTIGNLPTRASVYATVPYFSEDYYLKKFGEVLKHGRPRPGVPIYNTISEELQVVFNSALTSTESAEMILDRAWKNVMIEYKK
ncbi:ABC transporter substrate-binding protein [Treponema sp.]